MGKFVARIMYIRIYLCIVAFLSMITLFVAEVNAFSPHNEEEVKNKLSRILASGEFGEKSKSKSILEILHEKFIEFIKKLWEKLNITNKLQNVFSGSKVSKEVMLVLQIIAIVLILTIIVLVIYFVAKKFKRSLKVRQEEDALLLNILKDPDEVYKRAFEYYNNGDYTQGLRFLYISLLIRFNDLNIIRINKAKTNKQYLSEIGDNKPEIHEVMLEFTQVFNRHWYGGKSADKAIFTNWNNAYSNLMGLVK